MEHSWRHLCAVIGFDFLSRRQKSVEGELPLQEILRAKVSNMLHQEIFSMPTGMQVLISMVVGNNEPICMPQQIARFLGTRPPQRTGMASLEPTVRRPSKVDVGFTSFQRMRLSSSAAVCACCVCP